MSITPTNASQMQNLRESGTRAELATVRASPEYAKEQKQSKFRNRAAKMKARLEEKKKKEKIEKKRAEIAAAVAEARKKMAKEEEESKNT